MSHIKENNVIHRVLEKGDLSNRHKMNGCSIQQVLRQNLSCF